MPHFCSYLLIFLIVLTACDDDISDVEISIPPPPEALPVPNQEPFIVFFIKNKKVGPNTKVELYSESTDIDGDIIGEHWVQLSGPKVDLFMQDSDSPYFISPVLTQAEILVFEYTAIDNKGSNVKELVDVLIEPTYVSPVATAFTSIPSGYVGQIIDLIGINSEGDIVNYLWEQIEGPEVIISDPTASLTTFIVPELEGEINFSFRLSVSSSRDEINSVEVDFLALKFSMGKLNDTGLSQCGGFNEGLFPCPLEDYLGQDGEYGRDALAIKGELNKVGSGRVGFDFTKVGNNGELLPPAASVWSCVLDNTTGLLWEVKTDDGSIRDVDNVFTWYNPDKNENGGDAGRLTENNTFSYVKSINISNLCGNESWRLPTANESLSIIDYSLYNPVIDTFFFPDARMGFQGHATSSTVASAPDSVWTVDYVSGLLGNSGHKNSSMKIRAVAVNH